MLCRDEFEVQGVRLVVQVLEPARGGGGRERKGLGRIYDRSTKEGVSLDFSGK